MRVPRVLPISPGDGRDLGEWLSIIDRPSLLREPGRAVAPWAAGHIVHEKCLDAPVAGAGLHVASTSPVPARPGLVGVSTHSVEEAVAAERAGADYVLLSPMFAPISKPLDTRPVLSIETVLGAQDRLGIPIVVLGGVTPERAHRLLRAGVYGVAVLGVLAADPHRIREYPC
ncbi:MAG: thiamine phosphate synthase [Proteobacteria bacterium]|nr:thiamine phosphate synthase [Pseudomonadota bacterium]MCP4915828.1 thiamine phosphate synthase [Pseudomonadota bacterium]